MSFESCSNYRDYLAYKEFKREHPLWYKGINLTEVCSHDLFMIMVSPNRIGISRMFRLLLGRICVDDFVQSFAKHDIVCSCESTAQRNYIQLISSISDSIHDAYLIKIRHIFFPWFNPFDAVRFLWWSLFYTRVVSIGSLTLAARLVYCTRTIDQLNKVFQNVDLSGKKYLPIIAQAGVESLLTRFFRKRGAVTFTLFHGLFGGSGQRIMDSVICGENVDSDYVLAWSTAQKMNLINDFCLDEDQVFVAGHPLYPQREINVSNKMLSCIVLGAHTFFDEENARMLKAIDSFASKQNGKISFHFKAHPSSNYQKYLGSEELKHIMLLDKRKLLSELLCSNRYDFAIIFNSTAYYECMYYGIIPLRWDSEVSNWHNGLDDKFRDEQTLQKLIEEYRNREPMAIANELSHTAQESLGMGINDYDNLVHSLN